MYHDAPKMWFLNASTVQLEDFPYNDAPDYAILSHTWQGNEIKSNDLNNTPTQKKASWNKVQNTCQKALEYGVKYVWIDTCCIDQDNEVRVSFAVNSMYDLYKNAKICFTYLADVPSDDNPSKRGSTFEKSRWFTRGWTLQELLAPSEVIFFSKEWMEIGRKTTMPSLLARITGIDEDILIHRKPIESASVATRMSWAANRQTTFVEDRAYSLMGIFGVSIPKLYWQDANAFIQLQQEIISRCNDHSIFAWTDTKASPSSPHGLLATSPSFFAGCHDIVSCNGPAPALPYTVANGILDITLPLHAIDNSTFAVALNCQLESESQTAGHLALYLKRVSEKDETYARIKVGSLAEVVERGPMKKIHVRESLTIKNDKGEFSSQASQPIKHSHFLSRSATKASVDNGKTKKPFWKLRFFRKWSNKFLVYSVAFCKSYSV